MTKNLRILYLKNPAPSDILAEEPQIRDLYQVRDVTFKKDLKVALSDFKPHVLLSHLNSEISVQEVLDIINEAEEKCPYIFTITEHQAGRIFPLLKVASEEIFEKAEATESGKGGSGFENYVYDHSLDGILLTEPDGHILSANPAACHILNMTEEEICNAGRSGITDVDDPKLATALSQREHLGQTQTELIFRRKGGTNFPVELTSSVFTDRDGKAKTVIIFRDITKKKEVEKQFRISNECYRTIFYESPIPYWIYDHDTLNIVDVNEIALKTYGYTRKEFLKLNLFDLRPKKQIKHLQQHLRENSGIKGAQRHGRFVHQTKSGVKMSVDVYGFRLQYAERNCRLVACIDVTEREKYMKRLKEKQAKLAAAQDMAKIGYWELDLSSGEVRISKMMQKICGLNEEVISLPALIKVIHPEDRHQFQVIHERTEHFVKDQFSEYRIVKPSGEVRWINERGRVLKFSKNLPKRIEYSVQDITEQKNFTEKLSISEARYKGIVKSQTNYLIRTDMRGHYTYCNEKFASDFGWLYEGQEILGKSSLSSILDYHHQAVYELVERCISTPGVAYQIELDKPKADGGIRTTLWDFVCLLSSEGEPSEIQCVGIDISARVQAERQLKETTLRYKLVTKATSDAIWDWDLKTGNLYWSKTLKSMLGHDPKHYQNLEAWDSIVHPDDSPRVLKELQLALEGSGKKWTAEYRVKMNSGKYAYVVEKGTILRNENKEPYRLVGAIRDITERKKLQDLLEKANRLSRIGSFELDLLSNRLFWSSMTKEIHGVPKDYVPDLERAVSFYKVGNNRNRLVRVLQQAKEKNRAFDEELEIITGDGREIWVRAMGQPEVEDGKCIRISGSFQDIDKIKRAEQHVIKAAREKTTLLESIGDAFFAVDETWTVTYWNKHAVKLLGCSKEKILKRNLWEVFADALNTDFHKNYEATMRDKKRRHFEAFFERTEAWYEVTVYPATDGLSIFFRDVTLRKNADIKLRELNKTLKDQTRELVTANKGLEQFSYIVSHNLRSPVANIIGLAELLRHNDYPAETKQQFYDEIFSNVERLDGVISDLNNILQAKVNIKAKKEHVIFQDLVDGILFSIQQLIKEEKVQVTCDFSQVPEILTVKSYLHSIFYNLIINSIKYKKPGNVPKIDISAIATGDSIVISFKDNGLGIDLGKRESEVFSLYKRFHHHIEGKGMGLFMVKTQVEMLGGNIRIQSEVNQGTTFTITLKASSTSINIKNGKAISLLGG